MVMELASRKSLFHVLNREGLIIGWPQALEWGAQSAAGTATLHKHDIVHRDLKSLNLLVTQDWIVKVADFGLARFNNEGNLETLNKMRGTMAYWYAAIVCSFCYAVSQFITHTVHLRLILHRRLTTNQTCTAWR